MSRSRTAAVAVLLVPVVAGAPDTPAASAQTGTGRVYVANALSNTVAVVDSTNAVATVPVGEYPVALAWLCFRHTAGATATGVVSFTVTL